MPVTDGDFDVRIALSGTSHKFKLLQQGGRKAWTVRELPPAPRLDIAGSQEEGLPPTQLLPFEMEDWSYGAGLLRFTPQNERVGHILRYADGFGIDTSEVGLVRHGPALLSNVGTLAADPISGVVLDDKVWFMTNEHLYSWDGTNLSLFWTNPDGANNLHMVVSGIYIFIAAGAKYWFTDGTTTPASRAFAADYFLPLGANLWRAHGTNKISSSRDDPDASLNPPWHATPNWSADILVGPGETINSLFSASGLLGVATQSTLYMIDSLGEAIELDNRLRIRRSASAFSIVNGTGGAVWFSDGRDIIRLVAEGFEIFDIQYGGPFYSTDDLPMSQYAPGEATIVAISQDIEHVYVTATRSGDTFIYKGKEVARNVYVWSPLVKDASASADIGFMGKLSGDTAPIFYFNDGTTIKRFHTQWDEFAASWELVTPQFTADRESWDKMFHQLNAFLEREANTQVTVSYRVNNTAAWATVGGTGIINTDGANTINVTTPIAGKKVQLRFVGATTNSANKVNLRSFMLEGILRPEERETLDFSVIVENKTQAAFLHSLRQEATAFATVTDRLGTARNVFVLPGFPVESEVTDEARKGIVRSFQLMAQSIS